MGDTHKQAALAACRAGISVVPPKQDGTKAPEGAWKQYQARPASESTVLAWYADAARTGVGVVTGAVSGNLEALDFDDRAALVELETAAETAGLGPLLARVKAGYCEHSPNGAHILYRCESIAGNTKLA
jgi:hypothetical protein